MRGARARVRVRSTRARTAATATALGADAAARALAHELCIDVDRGHVVDHHAHAQAALVLQQLLQHRRLARAEEAREQRDRHALLGGAGGRKETRSVRGRPQPRCIAGERTRSS